MRPVAAQPRGVEIVRRDDIRVAPPPARAGGRVVYAVGDVHGCYDLLVALLGAIVADAASLPPGERPLLIFCGDYVDRGPRSSEVLATLVWLSRHAPVEVAFLRGNHEAMMLAWLDRPGENRAWLRFGGAATLRAYGVDAPDDVGTDDLGEDCWRLRDALADRLPASHLDFLRGLPVRMTCGDYVFVHAGLRPGVALARQDDQDCLWIREGFVDREHRFEKIVVHGHSWESDTPVITRCRIGIDTGAYRTGTLTAVRLGPAAVDVIQARLDGGVVIADADTVMR